MDHSTNISCFYYKAMKYSVDSKSQGRHRHCYEWSQEGGSAVNQVLSPYHKMGKIHPMPWNLRVNNRVSFTMARAAVSHLHIHLWKVPFSNPIIQPLNRRLILWEVNKSGPFPLSWITNTRHHARHLRYMDKTETILAFKELTFPWTSPCDECWGKYDGW